MRVSRLTVSILAATLSATTFLASLPADARSSGRRGAAQAPMLQAMAVEPMDPSAVRDSFGQTPYAIRLSDQAAYPNCDLSRELVPLFGGGLQWQEVQTCHSESGPAN